MHRTTCAVERSDSSEARSCVEGDISGDHVEERMAGGERAVDREVVSLRFRERVHIFFFQAEDGIRDYKVTGVQTCALPICMSAGATGASRSASPPSTRNCTGVAVPARAVASIQGAARLTWGCCATRPYSDSGRPPRMARNSRSGRPLTVRTARENSSSADWLITCTAKPRATPSMMATRAVAVRQGCWRSSCQEKVRSRASMGGWSLALGGLHALCGQAQHAVGTARGLDGVRDQHQGGLVFPGLLQQQFHDLCGRAGVQVADRKSVV